MNNIKVYWASTTNNREVKMQNNIKVFYASATSNRCVSMLNEHEYSILFENEFHGVES